MIVYSNSRVIYLTNLGALFLNYIAKGVLKFARKSNDISFFFQTHVTLLWKEEIES